MAAVDTTVVSSPEVEDELGDDARQEKKKKFKPFKKVRNFFRGSSKKRFKTDEGSIKSHSTSALNQKGNMTEDDDDGGFRSAPRGLAGSRSISEDSIFKPDQKEPTIGVLRGTTVSMEGINTDLQTELFSKLRKRQASSSDIDEGLPLSPKSSLTTADLMFGGGYRKSVPASGKSASQGSENSLISVDGSENEEDLFKSNWKSGVASVVTKMPHSSSTDSPTDGQLETMDFEVVMRTNKSLSNEAAKHRISVKPKTRRSSKKSIYRRDNKAGEGLGLPDVKEESPVKENKPVSPVTKKDVQPKPQPQSQIGANVTLISTTIPVGPTIAENTSVPRSQARDIPVPSAGAKEDLKPSSPLSTSPVSQSMLQDVKLRSRPVSGKFENSEPSKDSGNELSQAFKKAKRISRRWETDSQPDLPDVTHKEPVVEVKEKVEERKTASVKLPSKNMTETKDNSKSPLSSPSNETATKSPTSGVSYVLKKEPLKPGVNKETLNTKTEPTKPTALNVDSKKQDVKVSVVVKQSSTETAGSSAKEAGSVESKPDKPEKDTVSPSKMSPSKLPLGSPEKLASPREEYRLKRQARSKTLPEQPVPKEMLQNALKADAASKPVNRLGSPPLSNRNPDYDNVVMRGEARGIPSKRASWASDSGSESSEPIWVVRARLKQAEQEKQQAENTNKPNKTAEKVVDEKPIAGTSSKPVSVAAKPTLASKPAISSVKPGTMAVSSGVKPVTSSVSSVTNSVKTSAAASEKSTTTTSNVITSSLVKTTSANVNSAQASVSTCRSTGSTFQSSLRSTMPTSKTSGVTPTSVKPSVASAGVKASVPASTKTATDSKPLSQSVKSVTEKTATAKSVFDRANSQKQSITKHSFDKPSSFGSVKPFSGVSTSVSKTESKDSDMKRTSSSETKKDDSKVLSSSIGGLSRQVSSSTEKTTSSVDRSVKPETSGGGNVPAWKQALNQRKKDSGPSQVKIEIIDKDEKLSKPVEKKVEQKQPTVQKVTGPIKDKASVQMRDKAVPEKCADAGNRSSKVLDMVKNFQNLQVT